MFALVTRLLDRDTRTGPSDGQRFPCTIPCSAFGEKAESEGLSWSSKDRRAHYPQGKTITAILPQLTLK